MDNIVRKNIVRKGEIAHHNVFHSYISLVRQNAALCGNGLTLYHTIPTFNTLISLLKILLGKGENAGNQHFLLFSQCFLPFL